MLHIFTLLCNQSPELFLSCMIKLCTRLNTNFHSSSHTTTPSPDLIILLLNLYEFATLIFISGIIYYWPFYSLFISLKIIFKVHPHACVRIPLPLSLDNIPLSVHIPCFVYPSLTEGHSFCLLATVIMPLMNIVNTCSSHCLYFFCVCAQKWSCWILW